MTMIMTAVALILLAGILSWSAGNARLAARLINTRGPSPPPRPPPKRLTASFQPIT